jgi:asparagine synthase (glutamine-hydrolysing)
MNDRQAHRGPDGEGFLLACLDGDTLSHHRVPHTKHWDGHAPARVALGHRRLAIIDLSDRGLQPMAAADGSVWIVFNGEIYNFADLRSELETHGYRTVTRTDTEVLLLAYLHWGEACLDRIRGMFGFAIWDGRHRRLFCARDRLGIKPFYYATVGGTFLFASEPKALLADARLTPVAHDEAVLGFLTHANCDYGERTMFRDILALPPGHALTVDLATGRIASGAYWRLAPEHSNGVGDARRVADLRGLLRDTVRRHLVSDVRVGSCLSGGLDSSTVVGMMGEVRRDDPDAAAALGSGIHTFTSCFADANYDERDYALEVARSVDAESHLVFPSPQEFWDDFERMAWHQDMPFASFSFFSQWRVMQTARDAGVKVLLDGQGGDEVFGGYAKFRYAYLASLLRSGRLPVLAREAWATLRQGDRYVLDIRKGYRYLPAPMRRALGVDSLLQRILRSDLRQSVVSESTPATRWWRYASSATPEHAATLMQRIQMDDITTDTLPMLLRMEDRSSMAFSLEARVPLLDHHVVEYGLSLPDHLKVRGGWSKYAVREAMRGIMPNRVRERITKLGFAAPDRPWLANDLRRRIEAMVSDGLRCAKYVDPDAILSWYGSPQAQRAGTEAYLGLFRVLSLEQWMRVFGVTAS